MRAAAWQPQRQQVSGRSVKTLRSDLEVACPAQGLAECKQLAVLIQGRS